MSTAPYPWQTAIWRSLLARRTRLPHALLLYGPAGLGKLDFANLFARTLLCATPREDGLACGACEACVWMDAGVHPDFWSLRPEAERVEAEAESGKEKKASQQISIAQVRALISRLGLAAHRGARRAVIIEPAESLNPYAANALLKTLEESSDEVTFMLVSHQPSRLPKTLLSRCERIRFDLPQPDVAREWLLARGLTDSAAYTRVGPLDQERLARSGAEQRRGALLAVLSDEHLDALDAARRLEAFPVPETVAWLVHWCYDLVAARLIGQSYFHTDFAVAAARLARACPAARLIALYRHVQEQARLARHPLNTRLYWEALLLRYQHVVRNGSGA